MPIDLELYRRRVPVSENPRVHLSAIDIAPDHPQHTLVFLHGYAGNATQWQYQLEDFSLNNRVIGLDMRGHGQSDRPASRYTMPEILADLEAALDYLNVDGKFILVGHSFGGAAATEFAGAHPERLERLVLIATAGEYRLNPLYRFLLKLPLPILRLIGLFTRNWLSAPPQVLKPLYDNNLSHWNGWSLFRDLAVPTLVVRGHRDLVFEQPMFEEVTRAIPGAEEVNVGASGHMVMLERRQAVNRAIQRFLEDTRRPWRELETKPQDSARAWLVQHRPWLAHYDTEVPYTISVPDIAVPELLESAVRRFPGREALIFEGRKITYRRLNREVNRLANALRSLGLDNGDRVMLLLPNTPQLVISFFGTLKAGGVAVFTLPTTERQELIRQIQESGARTLVTVTQFADVALEACSATDIQHLIFTSVAAYLPPYKRLGLLLAADQRRAHRLKLPPGEGIHRFQSLLLSHPAQPPAIPLNSRDPAAIIFTGGTTSTPKGVMLSHRNLVANTFQTRHWMPDAREGQERFLCVLPFAHSYGLTSALILPISLGANLIIKPRFEVDDVLATIKRHQPTIFPGVPNMYVAIKDFPGARRYNIRSIKACISGAAPLPVEVQEAFEKLTRGRLVEGYGLTEASPVTHANPLNGLRKVGSIGIPLPSTEARIVDLNDRNRPVAVGQIGELAVRGPQVMLGYWQHPQETRAVLSDDGWLLTGDVAVMDNDGYFRLIARKADMWYPAKPGQPAFPRDVEEVLYEVPQVKEAAVVAIANQPVAFVIAQKDRPTPEALIAYCKRRLPPELVPRLVVFADEFPRSFIGKILRRELARRYEEHLHEPERD